MAEEKNREIQSYDLETAMKRLDEIAQSLSRENISLEASLALYEEGVALVRQCNSKLEAVERKINILKMNSNGEVSEQSFDTSSI